MYVFFILYHFYSPFFCAWQFLAFCELLLKFFCFCFLATRKKQEREQEEEEHNSFALITGPTIRIPFARRISPEFDNNNKIARSQSYCYKQLSPHLVSFGCRDAGEEEEEEERATVSRKRTKQ